MRDSALSGKVALITGVSRQKGIGAAIARALAQAGVNVFTTYYRSFDELMPWGSNPVEAEAIIESIKLYGVQAQGIEADLADTQVPKQLFDLVEESFGVVDILVNNAAHDQQADIFTIA